jgi:hypothetical protein
MTTDYKTHWKVLQNPDYIGAYWLPPGEDVTVSIDYVVREVITGTGGKKEECTVAHLQGVKPFILNATNCKTIAKLYGNYIEDWAGKQITLFATTTKMGGETVECLRIRPKVAVARTIPPITDARLDKALESIASGQFTVQQLREKFQLTPEQDAKVSEWEAVA